MHTGKRIILTIGATLIVLGCTEKRNSNVSEKSCRADDPSAILAHIDQMTNEVFALKRHQGSLDFRGLSQSLSSITNDNIKLELIGKLTDSILSLDVSSLSYRDQNNAMISIEQIMVDVVFSNLPSRYKTGLDIYFERYYDYKLRLLEWKRNQIKRTAPKNRIKNPDLVLDEREYNERQWWRLIHYNGISCYESDLRMLEGESQLYMRRISKESADRIRAKIENYLGRPLRSLDQLKADGKAKRRVEFTEPDDPHAAP